MVAEYHLKVPGWAVAAGSRRLLPAAMFREPEQAVFMHQTRVHPIYFAFQEQRNDQVTITLPPDLAPSGLPPPASSDIKVVRYQLGAERVADKLTLKRQFEIGTLFVPTQYYPQLHDVFQKIKAGDEQQLLLAPVAHAASR